MKKISISVLLSFLMLIGFAQSANELLQKVRAKYEKVNDYTAKGKMKTNVLFLKVPVANVVIYFKKPNLLKIKNEKGISFVPKGSVNLSLANILSEKDFSLIDVGSDKVNGVAVRVIKLVPNQEDSEVELSTLYIDEKKLLVVKARTTTKDNGTYELQLTYGKYEEYGLPDKVFFSFNVKEYKLPKGITFDYDNNAEQTTDNKDKMKNKKGKVEITYSAYQINQGIAENIFK